MNADDLKEMSGEALDKAGVSMNLERITTTRGHGFDETDDSYRRRLLASIVGAAAAGAMSQPADILAPAAPPAPTAPAAPALRDDGPTVEEFVLAGYPADKYPPEGYASKSSKEEIDAAIAAQKAAKAHVHPEADKHDADGGKPADTKTADAAKSTDAGGAEKLP